MSMYQENLGLPEINEDYDSLQETVYRIYETAETINMKKTETALAVQAAEEALRPEVQSYIQDHPEQTDFTPKAGHAYTLLKDWFVKLRLDLVAQEKLRNELHQDLANSLVGRQVRVTAYNSEPTAEISGTVESVSAMMGSFTIRHSQTELSEIFVFRQTEDGRRERAVELAPIDELQPS